MDLDEGHETSPFVDVSIMHLQWVSLLLSGFMMVAHGKYCSDPARNVCPATGSTAITMSDCGLEDADLIDWSTCFDTIGRSGITSITLSRNNIDSLPEDLFSGMTSLNSLYLDTNAISSLPPGLFADSTAMKNLNLGKNDLSTLPAGVFAGLTSLETLFLRDNIISTMPLDLFDELASLLTLVLDSNNLSALRPGQFAGVPQLGALYLGNNDLTTLPRGLFSDLTLLSLLVLDATVSCVPVNVATANPTGDICECTLPDDVLCDAGTACIPGVNDITPGYTCGGEVGTGGDPHMVGFSGQRIDWKGNDGSWYALLSDTEADVLMSVRLTAPLPVEFPERQLMTGFGIKYKGDHSVIIEIKDPYTTETDGCPNDMQTACLSENALKLTVDGEEILAVASAKSYIGGGASMMRSNLPAECLPYGGDAIWANTFANIATQRQLATDQTLDDWVLSWSDTTAAPAWCEKFVAESGVDGLLHENNKHTVFRIDTPNLSVRLHSGTNHQGGEVLEDGRTLPHLEFWQMDLHLEYFDLNTNTVTGILGETVRPVLDATGHPIMSGPEALRGEVEDYRISGPMMSDFVGFHEQG